MHRVFSSHQFAVMCSPSPTWSSPVTVQVLSILPLPLWWTPCGSAFLHPAMDAAPWLRSAPCIPGTRKGGDLALAPTVTGHTVLPIGQGSHLPPPLMHYTTPQLQLQLHYTDYTAYNYNSTTLLLQLQLHYTTPHYIQQLWWGDHCNHCSHSKKYNTKQPLVHQWIRSVIHASQHLTPPIASYLWNFRHRPARYYW